MFLLDSSRTTTRGEHGWAQAAVSTTIVVVGIGAASYYSWKKIRESSATSKRYPPMCPTGLLETVDAFANGGLKDFLITQFQKCGKIFRVRLFVPGAPMVVIVANSHDAREIFKDPNTVKPRILYNVMDRFSSGPNIVSLQGGDDDQWFHRRKGMNPAFAKR
jgi:cytochrome P450